MDEIKSWELIQEEDISPSQWFPLFRHKVRLSKIDDPSGAKMHLNFMGRAQETHQIRGQHIFLFPKGYKIYQGHLKPFSDEQVDSLRKRISEVLTETKYKKMAELNLGMHSQQIERDRRGSRPLTETES